MPNIYKLTIELENVKSELDLLRSTNNYYKAKIERKLDEIINKPFASEEERDCQAYAIDVLDELLKG